MKRIATAAFALCLLGGTSALADNDHHNDNNTWHNNGGHNNNGGQNNHNNNNNNNGGQNNRNPQNFQQHNVQGPQNGGQHNLGPQEFRFQGAPQHNGPEVYERHNEGGPDVYQRHHEGEFDNNPQVYEHRGRGVENFNSGRRPHYSVQAFPHVLHPQGQFHWRGGFWRGPPGWHYRNWYYGEFLPFAWLGSEWWINDYWDYDLPYPPYGYEWIRNGPDALLVNVDTGMIVEVVPGIFY
ncbi:MAG TPA: RcnB family protein [Caulobacteraceae bacterium]|nr:RcnB family protein [Caulobacteraceae bacterium]